MRTDPLFPFIWSGAAIAAESSDIQCLPGSDEPFFQWLIKFIVFAGIPIAYREWDKRQQKKEGER